MMKLSVFFRFMVLMWADLFAGYVMWLMMVYLTDVWKLDYTYAAAIINIWAGTVLLLPIAFAHFADAFLGNFCILLLSTLSYTIGLGLIWMSTPAVSGKSNNCTADKGECLGQHEKELLYAGLALVAIGLAGHLTSYNAYLAEQDDDGDARNIEVDARGCVVFFVGGFAAILIAMAGLTAMTFIKPWATRFGISAIFTLISTLVFISGICSYRYVRPQGSRLTVIFRVFFASASKILYRRPKDKTKLYERQNIGVHALLPHTKGLRCLDKASIVLPEKPLEQQEKNQWQLCTVTEVEETKIFLRTIPMCLTFIVCGVVSSIGQTYFLEQAKNMDRKVGRVKVPLILFLAFYQQAKALFSKLYTKISNASGGRQGNRRFVPSVAMAVGMVLSVLCCITAAKVENRRLGIVETHGLIDKPDEKVPMSIFWLLPQFLLLGAIDGIYYLSATCFLVDQVSPSMLRYVYLFAYGNFGAGFMGSALSVYIVGKVSHHVGKKSWFQSTINRSRLDNYYWVLAALSAANFVLYVVIAVYYRYRNSRVGELDNDDEDDDDNCLGDLICCC